MQNPFKFGTIVSDEFFTDRVKETLYIEQLLDSQNHLILISPRRYGKTSLIYKALSLTRRPSISVNLQGVTSSAEFASVLMRKLLANHPFEKLKKCPGKVSVHSDIEARSYECKR